MLKVEPSKIVNVDDKFDLEYDSDEYRTYVSTEKYMHIDDDGELSSFKYQYVICCSDFYCEGKGLASIEMMLVVCPESYCKDELDKMCNELCICEDDIFIGDIADHRERGCVTMAQEKVVYDVPCYDEFTPFTNPSVLEAINNIASRVDAINCMLGFFLDEVGDWFGFLWDKKTGWDVIRKVVCGE